MPVPPGLYRFVRCRTPKYWQLFCSQLHSWAPHSQIADAVWGFLVLQTKHGVATFKVRCWGRTHAVGGEKGGKGAGSEREGRAWGMQLVAIVKWDESEDFHWSLWLHPLSGVSSCVGMALTSSSVQSRHQGCGCLSTCCPRQLHPLCLNWPCCAWKLKASRQRCLSPQRRVKAIEHWPLTSIPSLHFPG